MDPPPPISGIHFPPPPCLKPYYYHLKLQQAHYWPLPPSTWWRSLFSFFSLWPDLPTLGSGSTSCYPLGWKAEDMKKILWHVTPFTCLVGPTPEQLPGWATLSPLQVLSFYTSAIHWESVLLTWNYPIWPIWPQSKQVPGSPVYFAAQWYHGIISQKNRLVLPMNSRKVKQEHLKYRSQACKAHERHDMSHYLHILSLSSLVKTRRYFYYIHNWSHSQMLMLLKKKFWISSSFPCWYCPWIIYYFISDLFSISFMNK